MRKNKSVGILGGGISGLAVACELYRKGVEVAVYEKSSRPGGVIRSERRDGWLTEMGPNTLAVNKPQLWDFLKGLQLTDSILETDSQARKRFIVKNGIPLSIPLSTIDFIKSDLFSTSAKFRLLKEPFLPASKQTDESISTFITRRLGQELLDYAVDPFVSGIYAGTPETLSVKHTFSRLWELEQNNGSLTKGVFRNKKSGAKTERALISFKEGLETLPQTMCERLGDAVQCNTEVQGVSRNSEGWTVRLRHADGFFEAQHTLIVSAVPVYTLQQVFKEEARAGLDKLANISYAPLSVVSLGFQRKQIEHPLDGFGMLIPAAEPYRLLGTLFSSSLFPSRAPDGHVLLTSFIGGARNPGLAHRFAEELMAIAIQDLSHLLKIHGTPVFSSHTHWSRAIPQYKVGYDIYIEAMNELEREHPGLLLAGNFRGGVSVPDCIINGLETARRAVKVLASRSG